MPSCWVKMVSSVTMASSRAWRPIVSMSRPRPAGAAFVLHHMEDYLQTEFSDLRVWLTSVTEQWAVIAVQGPRAADVLAPFIPDVDLAAHAAHERAGHGVWAMCRSGCSV